MEHESNVKTTKTNVERNKSKSRMELRKLVKIAVLAAVAAVLMLVDFPLPFAPPFYELDFSEIPVLVGGFALGPVAGIIIELLKVLLKGLLKGTATVGIGELANFLIGCSLVVPASTIYRHKKTFKNAIVGLSVGVFCLTIVGSALNYFMLIPFYSVAYMPIDKIIGMGTAVNGFIHDKLTLVLYAVAPFNLLKGVASSCITMLIYKRLSPILHK